MGKKKQDYATEQYRCADPYLPTKSSQGFHVMFFSFHTTRPVFLSAKKGDSDAELQISASVKCMYDMDRDAGFQLTNNNETVFKSTDV